MNKIVLFLFFLTTFCFSSIAFDLKLTPPNIDTLHDNNDTAPDRIHIRTYLDVHYAYDSGLPQNRKRPYGSNPLYVNQFDIGYAFAELSYHTSRFRSTIALHTGSIVEQKYENENDLMKRIKELSGEYYIGKGLSIEGGVMPEMYSFEGFINKENWFSTRSAMTDFAPDFDMGVRLNYKTKNHWTFRTQIANGWQILHETNNNKSFGTLIRYDNKHFLFNWGTMTTNESTVDTINLERFYSNLFLKFQLGKKWQIAPLWDFGIQRDSFDVRKINYWQSASLNFRYQFNDKFNLAARGEFFYDPKEIIHELKTETVHGFQYKSVAMCIEYTFHQYASFRLEAKYSTARDKIYMIKNVPNSSNNDFIVMGQFLFELHHHLKVEGSY
jgi:hypothetical protein